MREVRAYAGYNDKVFATAAEARTSIILGVILEILQKAGGPPPPYLGMLKLAERWDEVCARVAAETKEI